MRNDFSTSPDTGRAGAIGAIDPVRWNALNRDGNPFVDHRFLAALTETGAIGPHTGWDEATVTLGDDPTGFAPAWIKYNSHGEFVFDFVWADAAHRAGLRWFPKLLVASPLTPVTGPRLFGESTAAREALVERLEQRVNDEDLSCCSVNFCDALDSEVLEQAGWLGRHDWQFHWPNRGYRDFDDFLAALRSKPRKNIRRERRLARQDGWRYRWVDGESMTGDELELLVRCYQDTFRLYGNLPLLNAGFFRLAARRFGTQFLACIASQHGRDLACSVFWRNATRLYGRYWGALIETRDVHFEACYYQGIEYCIEHGLETFEPGAQGEHKIRRGFVPQKTRSWHYIRHPALREGIRRWLEMERQALQTYRNELRGLEPYREASGP